MKKLILIPIIIITLALIGEVKYIIKVLNCNWEPIGKAEVVYTIGACTGFGTIIEYIEIKDK